MVQLLGIPFDANSSYLRGPALAPALIRKMWMDGSSNDFSEQGMEIREGISFVDCGDLEFPDQQSVTAFENILQSAGRLLQREKKIFSLGGDHSVSYPLIAAVAGFHHPLHVLHIDAHADLYHNFDDNPYSHASPFARILERNLIASLTQAGIRTLTTHQREQAKKFGVSIIEAAGFSHSFVDELKGPLYISLDLDALDPAFAPGVSHHEPGGLSTREVIDMIQRIHVPVVGADIVEYNPLRDTHQVTAMVAYKLFKELMSKMY
ncbi:MAG: agmatinase [Chitinophagales bacterium]|nr:agmatinase [Chitinophagales bacterium]